MIDLVGGPLLVDLGRPGAPLNAALLKANQLEFSFCYVSNN